MKLIDMKRPKKTKKELKAEMTAPEAGDQERYPYGLRLNFDKEEIDKITILKNINAGDTVKIQAVAKVIEVRITDAEKERRRHNIELQIQKISMTNKIFEQREAEAAFDEGAKD